MTLLIERLAWDVTVGAGNDSENVNFKLLANELNRMPTEEEKRAFAKAWKRYLQEMAQP